MLMGVLNLKPEKKKTPLVPSVEPFGKAQKMYEKLCLKNDFN